MNFELQSYQMSNLEETVILQTAQNAAYRTGRIELNGQQELFCKF